MNNEDLQYKNGDEATIENGKNKKKSDPNWYTLEAAIIILFAFAILAFKLLLK